MVGLSALAQPRLTKGGQPYQGSYVVTRSRPYLARRSREYVFPNRQPLSANRQYPDYSST